MGDIVAGDSLEMFVRCSNRPPTPNQTPVLIVQDALDGLSFVPQVPLGTRSHFWCILLTLPLNDSGALGAKLITSFSSWYGTTPFTP